MSIRGLAQLVSDGVDAELHVVGDGPQREELENLARKAGVAERVVFTGSLPATDVQRTMAEADIFLQHSLEHNGWVEGFGVSITEAAATGLPVVVSDCGGIADQVDDGHSGFLVPQGDLRAMTDRMRLLAQDPALRRSFGLAGRERAQTFFAAADQIRILEDVLLGALS